MKHVRIDPNAARRYNAEMEQAKDLRLSIHKLVADNDRKRGQNGRRKGNNNG